MIINLISNNFAYKATLSSIKEAEEKKSHFGKSIGALAVGYFAKEIASFPASIKPMSKLRAMSDTLNEDEVKLVKETAEKIITDTGLREKGVHTKYWAYNKPKNLLDVFKFLSPIGQVELGVNAAFSPVAISIPDVDNPKQKIKILEKNSINMPEKRLAASVFHEIGHAHNYNLIKWGKFCQSPVIRVCTLASTVLLPVLVAFSSKREAKPGEELSKKDKLHNTLRDNAYLLPIVAGIPTAIEEAAASFKGEKLAKDLLPENVLKVVKKSNRYGLTTYLATPFVLAGGIYLAKFVKDKFTASKKSE